MPLDDGCDGRVYGSGGWSWGQTVGSDSFEQNLQEQ